MKTIRVVAVASKHILTDAEIDAIPASREPTQEQRWADYTAYWQARSSAEPPAVAVQAAEVVAQAIREASAQEHTDNMSAATWDLIRGHAR